MPAELTPVPMLLHNSIEIEDDVLQFAFEVASQRVECMTNFEVAGEEMRLFKLHLEGNARNQVGREALWQVAYQLGRYFGVRTLRVEGGRRTTGRYKGQVPKPIIIIIPDL